MPCINNGSRVPQNLVQSCNDVNCACKNTSYSVNQICCPDLLDQPPAEQTLCNLLSLSPLNGFSGTYSDFNTLATTVFEAIAVANPQTSGVVFWNEIPVDLVSNLKLYGVINGGTGTIISPISGASGLTFNFIVSPSSFVVNGTIAMPSYDTNFSPCGIFTLF